MIKRTVEISREPAHLTVQLDQLVLKRGGQTVGSIPCEDIGVVLVDNPGTTYTHAALAQLAAADAAVVICGRDHLPAAIVLPLSDHSEVVWRVRDQLAAPKPLASNFGDKLFTQRFGHRPATFPPARRARGCWRWPEPSAPAIRKTARRRRPGFIGPRISRESRSAATVTATAPTRC